MATATPSAPGASGPKRSAKLVEYDRFIEQQLDKTRGQVRTVDIASSLLLLVTGTLLYFFLVALIDHWVMRTGLGFWGRLTFFAVYVVAALTFVIREIVPLLVRRINPVYAAVTIERSKPSLKNSLVNLLLFRGGNKPVPPALLDAMEQQAATSLAHMPEEAAIDQSKLIKIGYVGLAALAICAVYKVASPKDPFTTVRRVIMPWAEIASPSRVTIENIQPGNARAFRGEPVVISAEVFGVGSESPVTVFYSTEDGQAVDQAVAMAMPASDYRYLASIPPGPDGLQQRLTYRIEAGDARTPTYSIDVQAAPTFIVESVAFDYPTYTGLNDKTIENQGDVRGIEGTRVTISARANHEIKDAHIDFNCDGRDDVEMKAEGQTATGTFTLELEKDRKSAQYASYQLHFTNLDGYRNKQPTQYTIDVTPDLPPEVSITAPKKERVQLPINSMASIEVQASDLDFALRRVTLHASAGKKPLLTKPLLDEERPGQFLGKFLLNPKQLKLNVGDVVEYWFTVEDNKSPTPSQVTSAHQFIAIVEPGKPGEQGAEQTAGQNADQQNDQGQEQRPGDGNRQPPKNGDARPMQEKPEEQNPNPRPEEEPNQVDGQQNQPQQGDPGRNQPDKREPNANKQRPDDKNQPAGDNPEAGDPQNNDPNKGNDQEPDENAAPQPMKQNPQDQKGNQAQDGAGGKGNAGERQPGDQKGADQKDGNNAGQNGDEPGQNDKGNQQPQGKQDAGNQNGGNQNAHNQKADNQKGGDQRPGAKEQQGGDAQPNREPQQQQPEKPVAKDGADDGNAIEKILQHREEQKKNQPQQAGGDNRQKPNDQPDKKPAGQGNPNEVPNQERNPGAKQPEREQQDNQQGDGANQRAQQEDNQPSEKQQPGAGENPAGENGNQNGADPMNQGPMQNGPMHGGAGQQQKQPGDQQNAGDAQEAPGQQGKQPNGGDQQAKQPAGKQAQNPQKQNGEAQQPGAQQRPDQGKPQPNAQRDPNKQGNQNNAGQNAERQPANHNGKGRQPGPQDPPRGQQRPGDEGQEPNPTQVPQHNPQGNEQPKPSELPREQPQAGQRQEQQPQDKSGNGDKAQPDADGRQQQSGDKPRPDAKGGEPNEQKGQSGSGKPSEDKEGSPMPQDANQQRNKSDKDGQDKSAQKGDNPKSPSISKKQSDSKGESEGDRSGGGGEGGGQKGNGAGTGGGGNNTESDEGAGKGSQRGKGATSGKAGADQQADGQSGQQGDQQGSGSGKQAGQGDQPGGENSSDAQSNSQQGGNTSGENDTSPDGGGNSPAGGRPNNGENAGMQKGETAPGGADEANLDYTRKAADLAVNHLRDELKKDRPDPALLEKLGWNKDDLRNFLNRWDKMQQAAKVPGEKGEEAKRELDETLRSLGIRPRTSDLRSVKARDDQSHGLKESRRTPPPAEYAEQLRAYTKGTAQGRSN